MLKDAWTHADIPVGTMVRCLNSDRFSVPVGTVGKVIQTTNDGLSAGLVGVEWDLNHLVHEENQVTFNIAISASGLLDQQEENVMWEIIIWS